MAEEQRQPPNPAGELLFVLLRENLFDVFLNAPSLPVALLFRRNIGFRMLKPWVILLSVGIVNFVGSTAMVAAAFDRSKALGGLILYALALSTLGLGIFWRVAAWKKVKNQELWHTKSRGVSYLSKLLPLREDAVQRFVEPGITFAVGIVLFPVFQVLGTYLVGAAICLFLFEQLIHDWQLNQMLDQYDAIIDAKVAQDNAGFFDGSAAAATPPTIEQSSGVAVVVAPELQKVIAARRSQAKVVRDVQ